MYTALAIFAIIFLVLGVVTTSTLDTLNRYETRYDNVCELGEECKVKINVKAPLTDRVILYYKLTNFHQNHRRFVISKSAEQLDGKYVQYGDLINCAPLRGVNDSADEMYLPCGLATMSFCNDTYKLTTDNTFKESGIAWPSDIDRMFKPLSDKYKTGIRWLENYSDFPGAQINEHFIVWMRPSALPTVVKSYAICENCNIQPGEYEITIKNEYPVSGFLGEKYVGLYEDTFFGPKNVSYGIISLVYAALCILSGLGIYVVRMVKPRQDGDMDLITRMVMRSE